MLAWNFLLLKGKKIHLKSWRGAGCVVMKWKLKLTGRLFTPTVCSGSLATQLQAAAIHLCQLIKNGHLLVCRGEDEKNQPSFNWAQYLQTSACSQLAVVGATVCFVCGSWRRRHLVVTATRWRRRLYRLRRKLATFRRCNHFEGLKNAPCWLFSLSSAGYFCLPVKLVAPKHDCKAGLQKTLLNLYFPPPYMVRYF